MILECKDLTKTFVGKRAVSNVNLSMEKGRIYGLLGENGSGKTTWMKMTAGLTKPSSGEILYKDHPLCYRDKAEIAYMSTESFYYDYMKVEDVGQYYQDFFEDFDREKFNGLVEKAGLENRMKVRNLSSGMGAKLKIVATMSRKAVLCLLDEPLNGIDYKAREEIISLILSEAGEDNTIVISTHLLEEVESFIDEAIFIKSGEVLKVADLERERITSGRSLTDIYMDVM